MENQKIIRDLEGFHSKLLTQSSLKKEIEILDLKVEELNGKIIYAVGVQNTEELEKFEIERYDALLEVLELKENLLCHCWFSWLDPQIFKNFEDFTFDEILEATDSFNPSRKLGEGGFGDTYKGLLRRTEIAVMVPSLHNLNDSRELQHTYKLETVSKMRHPKIVQLLGVCREAPALIYEYVPNGNLNDLLACKDNKPPLSWQTRIRVASEICSALIYMHSCQPQSIIHGDLKPANVLFDDNLSCKLGGFGICSTVYTSKTSKMLYRTDRSDTSAYMVPELISGGELTTKSDVYSFGIMLHLLTGKSTLLLENEVVKALNKDNLISVLDTSAGDWPLVQAKELALLGLKCCRENWMRRPNPNVDEWKVVEWIRVFSETSSSSSSPDPGSDEDDPVPSHFMCPINQEVMEDPHIAADGFTYEAEALKSWIDRGHDTSPMTNLKLDNLRLIPNLTLRSAIREWQEQQPSTSTN